MRILVVDDELHSREGLRDCLVRVGHAVETAPDGWQAIEKVKHGCFEVAIVDLDLPASAGVVLTGGDLARILRGYSASMALIMVVAEEPASLSRQLFDLGVVEVLEKPISPARVKALLREMVGPEPRSGVRVPLGRLGPSPAAAAPGIQTG